MHARAYIRTYDVRTYIHTYIHTYTALMPIFQVYRGWSVVPKGRKENL